MATPTHVRILLVATVLAAASVASAKETPREELARAIQLFENFQDDAAAFALHDLLHHAPSAAVAAKAHIYLALILLNSADADGAKLEMQRAVSTDVMVDLPLGQSPKAQVLFAQARRELTTVGAPSPGGAPLAAPGPTASEHGMEGMLPADGAPAVTKEAAAPPEPAPSHLPAYLVGVGSLVAFGVGGLFGYLQQQALTNAKDPSQAPTVTALQNYAQSQYPQDGLIADILFGAGAAAGITAIILFATETPRHGQAASVSVSAGPQGLSLQGAF
jgi:hypothetical protein